MSSSLLYVDLRQCYPIGNMTRFQYEYDTSFFNGYYKVHNKTTPTTEVNRSKEKEPAELNDAESTVSVAFFVVVFVYGCVYVYTVLQ